MVRIVGYSHAGMYTDDFEATISFLTDKLGLPLEWREEDTNFAGFRLPSGQLFEVFGPDSESYAEVQEFYGGVGPANALWLGFEVEDVEAAREELIQQEGVEFIHEVRWSEDGASWAKFRGPDGHLYSVWRPEEPYRIT